MSYTSMAAVYDRLMRADVDYEAIADRIETLFSEYGKSPRIICDLAAGTGNVTLPMARRGYDMIAVDSSADMLGIAREKAADEGLDVLCVCQDMADLDLYGSADAFLCMIDGFNYILEPKRLKKIFSRINDCFLSWGGVFIFDISSAYKLEHILGDNTFVYDDGDLYYVWRNKLCRPAGLEFLDLTFFEKKKRGYRRFCETQIQKAYTAECIERLLLKAGFRDIRAFDGFTKNAPSQTSERILFSCRKAYENEEV